MSPNSITLYSKTQINRAGKIIANTSPHTSEYKKALSIVNDWRTCHAYPMNTFQATLRRKVSKYKSPIVAQRLKRLPTIINKLSRYPGMSLAPMQDVGGVRAVVNSIDEVRAIQAENESFKTDQGNEDWLEFFALVSSAFAHVQGSRGRLPPLSTLT